MPSLIARRRSVRSARRPVGFLLIMGFTHCGDHHRLTSAPQRARSQFRRSRATPELCRNEIRNFPLCRVGEEARRPP
jgi:hypothetical protein